MPNSAPPSFGSSKETTNYARLCRLLVDVGSQALRDTFDRFHPPASLHQDLTHPPAHPILQSLKKKCLNSTQWGKLFPASPASVSSANFDITLLILLLRNICGLSPPASTGSWNIPPPPSDVTTEANIARVRLYRNSIYGHASQASVDDSTFNCLWQHIRNALVGLGAGAGYGAAIDKLKIESMDPDVEEHYRELLKEWKRDDDNTKEKLLEIEEMLRQWRMEDDNSKDKLSAKMEGVLKTNITKYCSCNQMCRPVYAEVSSRSLFGFRPKRNGQLVETDGKQKPNFMKQNNLNKEVMTRPRERLLQVIFQTIIDFLKANSVFYSPEDLKIRKEISALVPF